MNERQFLISMLEQGIEIWSEGTQLRYRAAAGRMTPELRTQIRERKAEVLAFLQKNPSSRFERSPIKKVERGAGLPLSYAQERLWFLDQLEPGNPAYNVGGVLRVSGGMKVEVLERAVNEVVRRHEALRTRFEVRGREPVQVIGEEMGVRVATEDFAGLGPQEQERRVEELAQEEGATRFDLSRGPLLRVKVARLGEREHVLYFTMHHMVSDAWSMGVLVRELARLYEVFDGGNSSGPAELQVQYADYAVWQREWMKGGVLQKQLGYWKERLAGVGVLDLPTNHARPAVLSYRGSSESVAIGRELAGELNNLSRREGVTLFMTLSAAFKVLLSRCSGQEDIVVGTPIANRNRSETEGLIGFFVNTLAMRTDLSGDPTFSELLKREREVALGAYENQDVPFERVVAELGVERDASRNPLFQVMIVLQNAPEEVLEVKGLKFEPIHVKQRTAKFDLTLVLTESEKGLAGSLEYATDLYERETIVRMIGQWERMLEQAVKNPARKISELELMSEEERRHVVEGLNDSRREYPKGQCIHELFENQVQQTPDKLAVVYEGRELSYQELDRKANQLANYLGRLGVMPDERVGICLERSLEMIVGLLAILKAGGAYVPLDSQYPRERLKFMLGDAGVRVIVTQAGLAGQLPENGAKVVTVDEEWNAIAQESPCDRPIGPITPHNLAYITYTSGSTGQPKGVEVTHQGVVRLVKNTNFASLSPLDIFLQFAPISFDASTFEIWGCLLNGAKLVVFPARIPSLPELGDFIRQNQITILWLTANLFHQMVEEQSDHLRNVRQLLAGGDVLSVAHIRKALGKLNGCQLINGYGPTENTTFTCCRNITRADAGRASIPIGVPIANTKVYILDRELRPVPVGVKGELYAGGDGLARGYLGRPDLTAEKFLPDPFSNEPGARLYRTGDMGRYLADGNIELVGRKDHQVKIRGYRVELGEIESALARHPTVEQAVVLLREEGGLQRLVGYVVARAGAPASAAELRSYLKERLPNYMVPAVIVFVDRLPTNLNGKINRRALPVPDFQQLLAPRVSNGSLTEIEKKIAAAWEEVLNLKMTDVNANFFDVGGHSLLLPQLSASLGARLARPVSIVDILRHPTIADLAGHLTKDVEAVAPRLDVLPANRMNNGVQVRLRRMQAKSSG